jgi:two-component system, chemotaxis family, response regulator WspF
LPSLALKIQHLKSKMRIAIVNDMPIAVEALRRVVSSVSSYEMAWIARDGAEAVERCARDTPDLILMDLQMPVMNGVEATRNIMARSPCAILIVTSTVGGHAPDVFEAMGYGALDAICTPVLGRGGDPAGGTELLNKIARIGRLIGKPTPPPSPHILIPPLLAIGASTGGPQALVALLSQLPDDFSAATVIVQHVDESFAPGLAEWLDQQVYLPVSVAIAGDRLAAGKVVIAATNDHLILQLNLTLQYVQEPIDYSYRPSVDVFFQSVAQHWPRPGAAVLLTGMGRDGAEGLKALRAAGWHTIAQDRESCAIYGMPKAALELDAAVEILPIEAIASACARKLSS